MQIKDKPSWWISENKVTTESDYLENQKRRQLLKTLGLIAGVSTLSAWPRWAWAESTLKYKKNELYKVPDENRSVTKEDLALSYNNFYEFSLDKGDVADNAKSWKIEKPWKVEIKGLKSGSKTLDVDQIVQMSALGGPEERIYRFRCVEAWSMVLPWIGIPLADFIKKLDPSPKAKFVQFQTFSDPKIGPNIKKLPHYPWPYTEGLTMEEALHPLAFLATGLYGKELSKQNGAPIRLVIPWKYGFKSIKSIVKIEFMETQPKTLWSDLAPAEYGFYANVNPLKDHPRWSQATERVINGKFIPTRIPTLPFNGYEKEVAGLYKNLDLMKNY